MANAKKLLAKMRANPKDDWLINNLKTVATAHDITWRQRGTSHVVFIRNDQKTIPIPAKRPIKSMYVKQFVDFVEE